MVNSFFILEKTTNNTFKYRLTIKSWEKKLFVARVQDKRPWQKWNIFCIREKPWADNSDIIWEIENIPISNIHRYWKKISISLDR